MRRILSEIEIENGNYIINLEKKIKICPLKTDGFNLSARFNTCVNDPNREASSMIASTRRLSALSFNISILTQNFNPHQFTNR